jgi:3-oxoadipate enol-lactonase
MMNAMSKLELKEVSLSYQQAGSSGPCVLLVQGAGCVGEGWRAEVENLQRDHQLAWLDNRGIGDSLPLRGTVSISAMADDCLALLDRLGWERAHLVGHSMGGLIIAELARRAPARVQSLGLLSTLRRGRDATWLSLPTLWATIRRMFGEERTRWLRFSELAFPAEFRSGLDDDALLALLRPAFCRDFVYNPPIVSQQVRALFRHTGGDMAPLQKLPTLIATGALDRIIDTSYSDDLARCLPQARLVRMADAGHAVILQKPTEISQLLRDHIAAAEKK